MRPPRAASFRLRRRSEGCGCLDGGAHGAEDGEGGQGLAAVRRREGRPDDVLAGAGAAREADSIPSTVVPVRSTRATTPVARIVYQMAVDIEVEVAASISGAPHLS